MDNCGYYCATGAGTLVVDLLQLARLVVMISGALVLAVANLLLPVLQTNCCSVLLPSALMVWALDAALDGSLDAKVLGADGVVMPVPVAPMSRGTRSTYAYVAHDPEAVTAAAARRATSRAAVVAHHVSRLTAPAHAAVVPSVVPGARGRSYTFGAPGSAPLRAAPSWRAPVAAAARR